MSSRRPGIRVDTWSAGAELFEKLYVGVSVVRLGCEQHCSTRCRLTEALQLCTVGVTPLMPQKPFSLGAKANIAGNELRVVLFSHPESSRACRARKGK